MKLLEDRDFGMVCLCAMRYSMGRQTYMPHYIQGFIAGHICMIDTASITAMINDIQSARDSQMPMPLGDPKIDEPGWIAFQDFLLGVKLEREKHERFAIHDEEEDDDE